MVRTYLPRPRSHTHSKTCHRSHTRLVLNHYKKFLIYLLISTYECRFVGKFNIIYKLLSTFIFVRKIVINRILTMNSTSCEFYNLYTYSLVKVCRLFIINIFNTNIIIVINMIIKLLILLIIILLLIFLLFY